MGGTIADEKNSYIARTARDTHWHPIAYHLYNACVATGGSVDAWAAGVSIAVEAIASLVDLNAQKDERLALYQDRALKWFADQTDLVDIADRVKSQIAGMSRQTPKDKLYALAELGYVEKDYVKAWSDLRNRHVHPTLKDMKKPDADYYQRIMDQIHRTETLLRQVTFYLIGYVGPFTDYGIHGRQNFQSKHYPLAIEKVIES